MQHAPVLRNFWHLLRRRGVGLNMYWLWIKEHGHQRWIKYVLIVNRSQMSWSRLASRQKLLWPPASITRSWRRASKELSREHEINHHKRYLGMHARHRKASNYRRRYPAMILSWYLGSTRACPRIPPNRLLPLSMQPQEQHPCCHCCYHHQKLKI